jgi:DNA-directed RNA polymerase subunit RPC12/RpoP
MCFCRKYKCPYCSSKIGGKSIRIKKCTKCNKKLDSWDLEYMIYGEIRDIGN